MSYPPQTRRRRRQPARCPTLEWGISGYCWWRDACDTHPWLRKKIPWQHAAYYRHWICPTPSLLGFYSYDFVLEANDERHEKSLFLLFLFCNNVLFVFNPHNSWEQPSLSGRLIFCIENLPLPDEDMILQLSLYLDIYWFYWCYQTWTCSNTKREERGLERELRRNTEITRHGELTDPNRIWAPWSSDLHHTPL